jgi:hypothetical protein
VRYDCEDDLLDGVGFAEPGRRSALRAAARSPAADAGRTGAEQRRELT